MQNRLLICTLLIKFSKYTKTVRDYYRHNRKNRKTIHAFHSPSFAAITNHQEFSKPLPPLPSRLNSSPE